VIGALACLPAAAILWVGPTPHEWLMLGAIGLFGICSQWAMVRAYAVGESTAVAPFEYAQFIFAPLAGVLLFGDAVDAVTLAGIAIIIGAGIRLARASGAARG
jgi:drug/metabolite transporter (DMT)-like permease